MAIPLVDRARVVEALEQFDREDRSSAKWQGWEKKGNYKFAIVNDGQLYPVKEIVSTATGAAVSSFSGGTEANEYVRKLGFQVEPLELPRESEVRVELHDLLVTKAPNPIEPSAAYQIIADKLALPERLRTKWMENTEENHWHNRVRQARRKLVDAGIVDPSEDGHWKLKIREHPRVWVEKSLVLGRADRIKGENALGRSLWSPLRAQNGADIYRNMRLVQPNDIVLHLTDNTAFTGTSVVDGFARTDFIGVEGTNWAGLPCYRVALREFSALKTPLTKEQLVSAKDIRKRLTEIRRRHANLFYDPDLDLHQGGYLTEMPEELMTLLNDVYRAQVGHPLLARSPMSAPTVPVQAAAPERHSQSRNESDLPRRIWLYAPGERATHWDEFRKAKVAGIGWDQVGDLSVFRNAEAVKARMEQAYSEPTSLVNANQCFDFAHRMNVGDWIFVKRGRREIIGFGVVRSSYRFEDNRSFFKNIRDVEWQKAGSWPTAPGRMLSMKALTEITEDEALVDELEQLIEISDPVTSSTTLLRAPAPPYTAEDFSAESAIPQATIELWESRLKRKQHIIFQGPPGTGKTYVAERLARLLISNTHGMTETVQFHPSYSYEDFMHGIRPVVLDGQLVFQPTPGHFLKFCSLAGRAHNGSPCVLIIDEINRGNLSRIFGELMYLLEYRDKAIPLAGEDRPFGIPENVFVIGTMNTADRSIALVDHALRRRFSFIHLAPDYDVLRSHLEKNGLAADGLLQALQAVNAAIDDRNYEIGISYFLKDGADLRATLQDIWEGEIEPYLEEYFYDQPGKLAPLRWKALSGNVLAAWSAG